MPPRAASTLSAAAKAAAKAAAQDKTKGVCKTQAKAKTKAFCLKSASYEDGVDLGFSVGYQFKEEETAATDAAAAATAAASKTEIETLTIRNGVLKERLVAERKKTAAAVPAKSAEESVGDLATLQEELSRVKALVLEQPGPGVLETANANLAQTKSALALAQNRIKALEALEVTLRQKLVIAGTTIQDLVNNQK